MKTTSPSSPVATISDVRRRLDIWRKTREKRGPIPAPLWKEAVLLAGRHGIHPTARALRLDYYSLKRQMEVAQDPGPGPRPAFVEVAVVPPAGAPECLVELERPDGARMRVRLSRQEDLVVMAESFWRCRT